MLDLKVVLFLPVLLLGTVSCTTIAHDETFSVDRSLFDRGVTADSSSSKYLADPVKINNQNQTLQFYMEHREIYDWFGLILPVIPTMWFDQGRSRIVLQYQYDKGSLASSAGPLIWKAQADDIWQPSSRVRENCDRCSRCQGTVFFDFPQRIQSDQVHVRIENITAEPVDLTFTKHLQSQYFYLIADRFPRGYHELDCHE